MQDSSVSTVYRNVIDDVIARVKPDFVQEGVDEAVLDELRVLWEAKLQQSGVLEPEIPQKQPASSNHPPSQIPPLPSFLTSYPGVQSQAMSTIPQQSMPAYYSALSGLPPQHLSQPLQAPKVEQQQYSRPGFAASAGQPPPLHSSYTLAAHDLVPAPNRQDLGPAGPSATGAPLASSSTAATGQMGDSRKRKADDPQDAYGSRQRLQQTFPGQNHQNGAIPQQDGSGDPPEETDKGGDVEKEDNLSDVSSDDEKDEEVDNVVIAQFEKVSRTKNKWKCQLKDGIINIDGRDYLFHRASGEMQF